MNGRMHCFLGSKPSPHGVRAKISVENDGGPRFVVSITQQLVAMYLCSDFFHGSI